MKIRGRRNRTRLAVTVLVAVCIATALLLLGSRTARGYLHASALILDLLLPGHDSLLRPFTVEPKLESVVLPILGETTEARFYRPAGNGPHGAIILVLGYPSAIDDEPLNAVAKDLARLGYAVLIPHLPHLRKGELDVEDVEILVRSFEWLQGSQNVDDQRIGFGGFCVGSSLALLAASDERIRDQVALVNVFGGYYDLPSYVRAIAAWSTAYAGQENTWQPSPDTEALLVHNLFRYLPRPEEADVLARRLLGEVGDDTFLLSTTGQWVYRLLSAPTPAHVDALLDDPPPEYITFVDTLSPSNHIEQLRAKVYVMHDLSDPFVPVVEAYRLVDAMPDKSRLRWAEFSLFRHVRPAPGQNRLQVLTEAVRLTGFLGPLLADLEPAPSGK